MVSVVCTSVEASVRSASNIALTIHQSRDLGQPVMVRMESGIRYRGVVTAIDSEGFELLQTPAKVAKRIEFAAVQSASPARDRKVLITVAVVASAVAVIWFLYSRCFYRC
jgi:hypothetical protein